MVQFNLIWSKKKKIESKEWNRDETDWSMTFDAKSTRQLLSAMNLIAATILVGVVTSHQKLAFVPFSIPISMGISGSAAINKR